VSDCIYVHVHLPTTRLARIHCAACAALSLPVTEVTLAQVVMLYLSVVTTAVTGAVRGGHRLAAAAAATAQLRGGGARTGGGGRGGLVESAVHHQGLARAPAARATAMGYTAVVLAAAADWALFGVCLDACAAVGGALIVLTALCVVLRR